MMEDFEPIMAADDVKLTRLYLTELRKLERDLVPALTAEKIAEYRTYVTILDTMQQDLKALFPALAAELRLDEDFLRSSFLRASPALAEQVTVLPVMKEGLDDVVTLLEEDTILIERLPLYLDHYDGLVTRMEMNVSNFHDANTIPMSLIPWLFEVLGVTLVVVGSLQLLALRRVFKKPI